MTDDGFLDRVPAMSATVLGLEILLHEPVIDLQLAVDLVLSDIGATIQTLRLASLACETHEQRPYRMGDCLASLETDVWFSAISSNTFSCDRVHAETTALWRHCRLIAEHAQCIADSVGCAVPEEAYLVGLLHGVSELPRILGWAESDAAALAAIDALLPLFVRQALCDARDPHSRSSWNFILGAAHERAAQWQEPQAAAAHDAGACGGTLRQSKN